MFGVRFHFSSVRDLNWQQSRKIIMTYYIRASGICHLLLISPMLMVLKKKREIGSASLKAAIECC